MPKLHSVPDHLKQFENLIELHSDPQKSMDFYAFTSMEFALNRFREIGDVIAIKTMERFVMLYEASSLIREVENMVAL